MLMLFSGIEADIDSDANDKDDMRMWEGDGNNKKSFLLKGPSRRSFLFEFQNKINFLTLIFLFSYFASKICY